jgi:phosphoglycolate phosphatase-like HAD superfamily hydrolase
VEELNEHLGCFRVVDGVSDLLPRLKAAGLKSALVSNPTAPYEQVITS